MFIKDWWDIWIYLGAFLFVTMRPQTSSLIKGFFFKRKAKKTLEDKKILDFIFNKTGLKLKKITVIEDDRLLGMMGGGLVKPFMILTTLAVELLNKGEMQWLLLHEAGHNRLHHSLKIALVLFLIFIPGSLFVGIYNNLYLSIFMDIFFGAAFGALANQFTRNFEYSANKYALKRMDNPKDAITAAQKIIERYKQKGLEDTFYRKLFSVWILEIYRDLIKDANKELERRKNK